MNIAICDDDETFLDNVLLPCIERALEAVNVQPDTANTKKYTNGMELLKYVESDKDYFDIIMLDISMPEINGKELAEKLRRLNSRFFLVFITDYRDEVFNVFEYNVSDFIHKDQDETKYTEKLNSVFKRYKDHNPECNFLHIFDEYDNKYKKKIYDDDICYLYCNQRENFICTYSEKYRLAYRTFQEAADIYIKKGFFKICRTYIVNPTKVEEIFETDVRMINGEKLPLCRGKKKELFEILSHRFGKELFK